MKKEIAFAWADDLESGLFEQGRTYLRTKDNKFCCLGILTERAAKEGIISEPIIQGGVGQSRYIYDGLCTAVPKKILQWSGLKDSMGDLQHTNEYSKYANLAEANDSAKLSFKQIAKIIRENWEKI